MSKVRSQKDAKEGEKKRREVLRVTTVGDNDARLYFTEGVSKHTACETDHIRVDKRGGAEREQLHCQVTLWMDAT